MKNTFKRSGAALISLVLLLVLAVSAGAASSQNVGVKFWKERSDKESMANSGIDPDRTATLTRQANGTYTLTLPVMQVSSRLKTVGESSPRRVCTSSRLRRVVGGRSINASSRCTCTLWMCVSERPCVCSA